jgi:hypothetical protein
MQAKGQRIAQHVIANRPMTTSPFVDEEVVFILSKFIELSY